MTDVEEIVLKINTELRLEIWDGFPQFITLDLGGGKPPGEIQFTYINTEGDLTVYFSKTFKEPSAHNSKPILNPYEIKLKRAISKD